ncbi:MAG: type II secretion system protein [Gammaproteobacteria bacterium]|nr:type II secretion system protein [Gammaproteobacteria bacterium]
MHVIKSQRGIGLLELMLSLAIIAILLVMATRYFGSARQGQQVAQAISMVQAISAASQNYFVANSNSMAGVSAILASGNSYLVNPPKNGPWGGSVKVSADSGNASAVDITIPNVPDAAACTSLMSALGTESAQNAKAPSCAPGAAGFSGGF